MDVKAPPARILPSACTAIAPTILSAFGLNESANPVVASSRAMKLRVCPPMLFAPKKSPPTRILPSACTAIEWTSPFAFGLKAVSSVPSVFNRAMLLRGTPRTVVKLPPMKNLAVRLNGGGEHGTADDIGIDERAVEPAVGFQAGDAVASHRYSFIRRQRGEKASRQNLAVACTAIERQDRLRSGRTNRATRSPDRAGQCNCAPGQSFRPACPMAQWL